MSGVRPSRETTARRRTDLPVPLHCPEFRAAADRASSGEKCRIGSRRQGALVHMRQGTGARERGHGLCNRNTPIPPGGMGLQMDRSKGRKLARTRGRAEIESRTGESQFRVVGRYRDLPTPTIAAAIINSESVLGSGTMVRVPLTRWIWESG
jgi:hypothetical protein